MPRTPRGDCPGAWHHVMNRGVARRTVFEGERDVRRFLAGVARAVRAGLLEVHAYSVLTTHYHLLVRSPGGELAEAMRRIQNDYARRFNRARRRDGPLFRGRYRSRLVETWAYRQILVQYIDANAVDARLVPDARLFPHGSARWYGRERGPVWLARDWVESFVRSACGAASYRPEDYGRVFGGPSSNLQRLVERRIGCRGDARDPLEQLLDGGAETVLSWMRRKAALADGTEPWMPVAEPGDVREVLERARGVPLPLEIALLRDLAGITFAECGRRVGVTESGAWKLYAQHRARLEADREYGEQAASLARQVVGGKYGARHASFHGPDAPGTPSRQAAVERSVPGTVLSAGQREAK